VVASLVRWLFGPKMIASLILHVATADHRSPPQYGWD
jgi:hypothetical protein